MAVRWRTAAADRKGPGDLAHVDGALGVHGEPVRRGKAAGGRGVWVPTGRASEWPFGSKMLHPAVARLRNGTEALGSVARVPPELGDVGPPWASKTMWVGRWMSVHSLRYSPSGLKSGCGSLSRSQTKTRPSDATAMPCGRSTSPRAAAWRAPRALELSAGGKLMHAAVAVAVGHVQVALRAHRDVGGAVEGACPTRDRHEVLAVIPRVRRVS